MTLYKWSQTASADATADSTINWAEGQAPSSVNDSARVMMAATAKYRDDIAGAILTTGTGTAYAVSSYQGFDTLAHLANQVIAFTPHATNGQTVTLNVDSLGAKPLRTSPGIELPAGTIIQGSLFLEFRQHAADRPILVTSQIGSTIYKGAHRRVLPRLERAAPCRHMDGNPILGYAARGVPSPYLWSGTDQYKSGKYVRDGVYESAAVDAQPGCAGLLLAIMALDRTVSFDGKMPSIVVSSSQPKPAQDNARARSPSIANPSKGSIGAFVASLFSTIFNSKGK